MYFLLNKNRPQNNISRSFLGPPVAFIYLMDHEFFAIGGRAILDQVEAQVGLENEKLRATRQVLNDYGNMSSACVFFIMDEMRKKSLENGQTTTGEGQEFGVLFGFGPGITVETVVLRSVPIID